MTTAGCVICRGLPRISDKPVSITHNRSHSSTRIRNVEIIDELSANWPSAMVAFGAFVRPPVVIVSAVDIVPSDSNEFTSQLGYGINCGLGSVLLIFT